MKPSLFVCLLVASLLLVAVAIWFNGPGRKQLGSRANGNGVMAQDKGILALVAVIRRWMDEPVSHRTPDLSRYRKLVLPPQICTSLRALTDLSHECAGEMHFDGSGHGDGGILTVERFDREEGGAMSSSVPTGVVVYHTHARPAYRGGNSVNFPSPHDILGVVALALPGRGNLCSLVATREGIYCLRTRANLIGALAQSGNIEASCTGIAENVQRLVDSYTSTANIGGYCNGLEQMGISCTFRRWDGSTGAAIAFSIDEGFRSWEH